MKRKALGPYAREGHGFLLLYGGFYYGFRIDFDGHGGKDDNVARLFPQIAVGKAGAKELRLRVAKIIVTRESPKKPSHGLPKASFFIRFRPVHVLGSGRSLDQKVGSSGGIEEEKRAASEYNAIAPSSGVSFHRYPPRYLFAAGSLKSFVQDFPSLKTVGPRVEAGKLSRLDTSFAGTESQYLRIRPVAQ